MHDSFSINRLWLWPPLKQDYEFRRKCDISSLSYFTTARHRISIKTPLCFNIFCFSQFSLSLFVLSRNFVPHAISDRTPFKFYTYVQKIIKICWPSCPGNPGNPPFPFSPDSPDKLIIVFLTYNTQYDIF